MPKLPTPAVCRPILLSAGLLLFIFGARSQSSLPSGQDPWYTFPPGAETRWSSPENPNGLPANGGKENGSAKGHAYDAIEPGASHTLLDISGAGIINRIWITINDRSPEMLRALKFEIFWDHQDKPAVAAPLGDFFGIGLGKTTPFYNIAFANPEGRSFNCFIPMPFRTGARIRITNESGKKLGLLFYDVDYQLLKTVPADFLYFHAYWNRDTATTLGRDFELLPLVKGKGRFLGVNVGVNANPVYGDAWWGEGEVKMYLEGDRKYPTLNGTGTEDYIGTGWGQGVFSNPYAGCLTADPRNQQWTFYRFHVPDPVFFESGIRVTIQQMGGNMRSKILPLLKQQVPLVPVTTDVNGQMILLFDPKKSLEDFADGDGWTNFYRSDDMSSTAYFYLNTPVSNLPPLQPVGLRTVNLRTSQ